MRLNMVSGDILLSGDLRGDLVFSTVSGNLNIQIAGSASEYVWRIDGISSDVIVSDPRGNLSSNNGFVSSDSSGRPSIPEPADAPDAPVAPGQERTETIEPITPGSPSAIRINAVSGDVLLHFMR
jgi:hypothetical protein